MARNIEVVVNRHHLHEPEDDVAYWLSRPVEERISALTELRRALFDLDDDETRSRLSRVHRVLDLRSQDLADAERLRTDRD